MTARDRSRTRSTKWISRIQCGCQPEASGILTPGQVRRILSVRRQSVAPRRHDGFVPIAQNSVHASGQGVDNFVNFAFLGTWSNQALRLDLCE